MTQDGLCMDEWNGWRIAGVRPEIVAALHKLGITHRLIGLLGNNEENAACTAYRILGQDADPDDVASLVRAYIMGQTVVHDEVVASRCGLHGEQNQHVHSSAGMVEDLAQTRKQSQSLAPKRARVDTGESVSLRTQEIQATRTEAQRLLSLARQVPDAGCWQRVKGRMNAEEQLTRWFTPTKASSRKTYMNEFERFQILVILPHGLIVNIKV